MVTVVVVWSLGMLIAAATEAIWAEVPHPIPASVREPEAGPETGHSGDAHIGGQPVSVPMRAGRGGWAVPVTVVQLGDLGDWTTAGPAVDLAPGAGPSLRAPGALPGMRRHAWS